MRVELLTDRDAPAVVLRLTPLERLGALMLGDVEVPLSQLASACAVDRPWRERPWRGLRVGTGLPYVVLLGRLVVWPGSPADFAAVFGRGPALVLELLPGAPWRRVIASTPDAGQLAAALQKAVAERTRKAANAGAVVLKCEAGRSEAPH